MFWLKITHFIFHKIKINRQSFINLYCFSRPHIWCFLAHRGVPTLSFRNSSSNDLCCLAFQVFNIVLPYFYYVVWVGILNQVQNVCAFPKLKIIFNLCRNRGGWVCYITWINIHYFLLFWLQSGLELCMEEALQSWKFSSGPCFLLAELVKIPLWETHEQMNISNPLLRPLLHQGS